MFDLQAVAFASDTTRIFSFKLGRDVSNRVYAPSGSTSAFHTASHHLDRDERIVDFQKINTYHVSMVPYLLEKLKNTPDGAGNMLDNTLVIYGSAMGNSNLHNHKRCPLFFAGHAAGALKGNRHIKAADGTPMANALLSALNGLGVDITTLRRQDNGGDGFERGEIVRTTLAIVLFAIALHASEESVADARLRAAAQQAGASAGPAVAISNESVAKAAASRDLAAVRALLKQGADVNAAQGDGMTALHWAATLGDPSLAQMLLSAGANVRATTRLGGLTALHMAGQAGHAQVVAVLIAAGADPNLATATGATALMLAARSGSVETATRLVEAGADINRAEGAFGQTALMVAAGLDRADVVRLLLSRGAEWKKASKVVDLKALTAPAEQEGRQQGPGGGAAGRTDVAGVTRGYRYNELIGAQGGLTALHFAARQGSASSGACCSSTAALTSTSPARVTAPRRCWWRSSTGTSTSRRTWSSAARIRTCRARPACRRSMPQ